MRPFHAAYPLFFSPSLDPDDEGRVEPESELERRERMLGRFQKLVGELMQGAIRRTTFEPWEVELLLDLDQCALPPRRRMGILRRYAVAVRRQMKKGSGPPMKLSEFLQSKSTRRPSNL